MPQLTGFIPPCLPSKAADEIKLDGYRLMVRRDGR
jgi:ATP-dependent DNA ligase